MRVASRSARPGLDGPGFAPAGGVDGRLGEGNGFEDGAGGKGRVEGALDGAAGDGDDGSGGDGGRCEEEEEQEGALHRYEASIGIGSAGEGEGQRLRRESWAERHSKGSVAIQRGARRSFAVAALLGARARGKGSGSVESHGQSGTRREVLRCRHRGGTWARGRAAAPSKGMSRAAIAGKCCDTARGSALLRSRTALLGARARGKGSDSLTFAACMRGSVS